MGAHSTTLSISPIFYAVDRCSKGGGSKVPSYPQVSLERKCRIITTMIWISNPNSLKSDHTCNEKYGKFAEKLCGITERD